MSGLDRATGLNVRIVDHLGRREYLADRKADVQGNQVYRASDKHATYVRYSPVTPDDLTATNYHAFGCEPETPIYDPANRPVSISQGTPIRALF